MKLTSSPSTSSSTTNTFTAIFPITKSSISSSLCFLLRRILCFTNLPTHPSDQLQEIECHNSNHMSPKKPDDSATPTLVARLMGLDSVPDTINQMNYPSITRSKSMNSGDCTVEETEHRKQYSRAKASVSYRETPTFFELEDDDFFVISFDNGGKSGKPRSKKEKGEIGGRENEHRRRRKNRGSGDRKMSKEQRPRFKFEDNDTEELVLEIEDRNQVKARNRKKNREKSLEGVKIETESGSENSSPVSVLDHSLFNSDNEVPTSEKDPKNRNSSPRRKLASNLEHSTLNNETSLKENDKNPVASRKGKQSGLRRKGGRRRQKREKLELNKICSLAKADIAELEWMCNGGTIRDFKNWEDEVEVEVELSLQIVDKLVDEMVHELI